MRRAYPLALAGVLGAALLSGSVAATAQEIQWLRPGSPEPPAPGAEPPSPRGGGGAKDPYRGSPTVVSPKGKGPVSSPPSAPPGKASPPSTGQPRRGPKPQPPVVAPGWPIKRPLNPVIVRPRYNDRRRYDDRYRYDDRHRHDYPYGYPYPFPYPYYYGRPLVYLPLLPFAGYYVARWDDRYWADRLLWEDAITIYGDEGWVEFTLDCGARGERLWIEVRDGRSRIDWAEIVFEDGLVQVVDFSDRTLGPGLYQLLEFQGFRRVEFVRMTAQATTRDVRLILRLER